MTPSKAVQIIVILSAAKDLFFCLPETQGPSAFAQTARPQVAESQLADCPIAYCPIAQLPDFSIPQFSSPPHPLPQTRDVSQVVTAVPRIVIDGLADVHLSGIRVHELSREILRLD